MHDANIWGRADQWLGLADPDDDGDADDPDGTDIYTPDMGDPVAEAANANA